MLIALALAVISMCIVPPDAQYKGYFEWKTLACLTSMMLVIGAFKGIKMFTITAKKLISSLHNARRLCIALVAITFVGSIFIANDMALLTFLPLTFLVFKDYPRKSVIIFTVTMQTVAANLGGMIMPFGNPQSLYLYSYYHIGVAEFLSIMVIPFAVATVLILLACFLVKSEEVTETNHDMPLLDKKRALLYLILAIITLLGVFRVIDYRAVLCLVAGVILIVDRHAFKFVDYGLLITFFAFFIFANNMSRIAEVQSFVSGLLSKSVLLTGVLSCQFISNVPTSIFLSKFTSNYKGLLLATNIGGCGTLIASLASLISLKHFEMEVPHLTGKYIGVFSAVNFFFLAVMTAICLFI